MTLTTTRRRTFFSLCLDALGRGQHRRRLRQRLHAQSSPIAADVLEVRCLLSSVSTTIIADPGELGPVTSNTAMVTSAIPLEMTSSSVNGLQQAELDTELNAVNGSVYSNLDPGPNGYVFFADASGSLGFDDYDSINDDPINLTELGFVGGVTAAGGNFCLNSLMPPIRRCRIPSA